MSVRNKIKWTSTLKHCNPFIEIFTWNWNGNSFAAAKERPGRLVTSCDACTKTCMILPMMTHPTLGGVQQILKKFLSS